MPAELFRTLTATRDRPGHRMSALPVSLVMHGAALAALVTIPLLATDVLPAPPTRLLPALLATPVVPTPPPAMRPARRVPIAMNASTAAPVEAPRGVGDELARTPVQPDVPATPVSDLGSIVAGVEHLPVPVEAAPPPPPAPPKPSAPIRLVQLPKKVYDRAPVYPPAALAARVQGTVVIEAVIDASGVVQDARVVQSQALLDDAALAAVRQWRFTPTLVGGVPVPVILTVRVDFRLQ